MQKRKPDPETPAPPGLTDEEWVKMLDSFRLFAFNTYYGRSFATVSDMTLRFFWSIIASSRPLYDPDPIDGFDHRHRVIAWYRESTGCHRKRGCYVRAGSRPEPNPEPLCEFDDQED